MYKKLIEAMPPYYRKSRYTEEILRAAAAELEALEEKIKNAAKQRFAVSADTTLERWENEFGLKISNLDIDLRRKNLIAKIRGSGTTTKEKIQVLAQMITEQDDVKVIEFNSDYYFIVKIKLPFDNMVDKTRTLYSRISEIKPAHLNFHLRLTQENKANIKIASTIAVLQHVKILPLIPKEVRLTAKENVVVAAVYGQRIKIMAKE